MEKKTAYKWVSKGGEADGFAPGETITFHDGRKYLIVDEAPHPDRYLLIEVTAKNGKH